MFNLSEAFSVLRKLYNNRLKRYLSGDDESAFTEEEVILGSKERVRAFGSRFSSFENDETFLEDALCFLYIQKKLKHKATYTLEEVVDIIHEAMGEHNRFLRNCARQNTGISSSRAMSLEEEEFAQLTGADEVKRV